MPRCHKLPARSPSKPSIQNGFQQPVCGILGLTITLYSEKEHHGLVRSLNNYSHIVASKWCESSSLIVEHSNIVTRDSAHFRGSFEASTLLPHLPERGQQI